jgi:hypothetical protein
MEIYNHEQVEEIRKANHKMELDEAIIKVEIKAV